MAWRLRRDYRITHPKTGKPVDQTSFHVGFIMGAFPEGTSRPEGAKTFHTKAEAAAYNRTKLPGRGYQPERVVQ